MLLRYFYHTRLAHASYLVGCPATGEAIVVGTLSNTSTPPRPKGCASSP
jgi:hydroxyacylglutathione hydrolase